MSAELKDMTPTERYPELGEALGLDAKSILYFKREDLHPYGSHKGRSIPIMMDHYYAAGDRHFVISSSGNAALAAALHAIDMNKANKAPADKVSLDIFVGNNVAPHKLAKLKELADKHIRIMLKERPLQAVMQAVQDGARSLRQSTDDAALAGYASLAEELIGIPKLGAVFVGTSSGTTAQALAQYFLDKKMPIQVHIVQTSSCHPLSDAFETYDGPEEQSIADAITDITAMRKPALIPLIEKTGGRGWYATNSDIETAQELTEKHAGIDVSTNSALSVVGAMQAAYRGFDIKGSVVCLIGGE